MAEMYMGQIIQGGWNFAPRGTMMANGQLLPINQYSALYALFGTTYGGNGQQTFGLPDLRGRTAIGTGQGPGLANYVLGQIQGIESVILSQTQMPQHSHVASVSGTGTATMNVSTNKGNDNVAVAGSLLAKGVDLNGTGATPGIYIPAASSTGSVAIGGLNLAGAPVTVGVAGGSQPFSILQPLLAITYCVVTEGIFPSRN